MSHKIDPASRRRLAWERRERFLLSAQIAIIGALLAVVVNLAIFALCAGTTP